MFCKIWKDVINAKMGITFTIIIVTLVRVLAKHVKILKIVQIAFKIIIFMKKNVIRQINIIHPLVQFSIALIALLKINIS